MSTGRKSVAVVDDDEAFLEAITGLLSSLGYDVVPFGSGSEFLDAIEPQRFATLLTDFNMPKMTGVELQQIVRHAHPEIGVIIMTAARDEDFKRRALAAGAKTVLWKPFPVDELLKFLDVG
jgi:FixJ family two-component response regulator